MYYNMKANLQILTRQTKTVQNLSPKNGQTIKTTASNHNDNQKRYVLVSTGQASEVLSVI